MKKLVILILSVMTIMGGALPALASDINANHLLISTNISKDTNKNNPIIVYINGETYSFATSGEAIGSKIPQAVKVFSKEGIDIASAKSKNGEQEIEIRLEGNPTTGCSWEYSVNTEGIINEVSTEYIPNNSNAELMGSDGIYTWKFSALKEGTTEITFKYGQPWEKENVYETKTYICTVDKELNIFIKEK